MVDCVFVCLRACLIGRSLVFVCDFGWSLLVVARVCLSGWLLACLIVCGFVRSFVCVSVCVVWCA